jgi:hypothetical protein
VVVEIFHYQYFEVVFLLRSSSIGGHLYFMHLSTLPWSHKVIFILCICQLCLGQMCITLKFDQDPISGCLDIPLLISDHLSL